MAISKWQLRPLLVYRHGNKEVRDWMKAAAEHIEELEATIERRESSLEAYEEAMESDCEQIAELKARLERGRREIESVRFNTKRVGIGNVIHSVLDDIEQALSENT